MLHNIKRYRSLVAAFNRAFDNERNLENNSEALPLYHALPSLNWWYETVPQFDEHQFYDNFRMRKEHFQQLATLLALYIERKTSTMRAAIRLRRVIQKRWQQIANLFSSIKITKIGLWN